MPRTVGGQCLPGSQLPTLCCPPAWVLLPLARRALEAGVAGLGQSVDTRLLFLCFAPKLALRVSLGLSVFHCVTLSLRLSLFLSFLLRSRSAAQPALLPSPLYSRAFPQEAEPEGPPRPRCHDISVGGGLCCPGLCAEHWPPNGRQGTGVSCSCAVTSVGPWLGPPYLASSASCHLEKHHLLSTPGRKPCPDPDLLTNLLSLSLCLPSAKPIFSSANGCWKLGEEKTRQGRRLQDLHSSPFSLVPVHI